MAEIKLYRHPEYVRMERFWKMYRDMVDGDDEVMRNDYLTRFAVEDDATTDGRAAWLQRRQTTYFTNYCEPILSLWLALLFKYAPDLSKIESIITKEEQADITGYGLDIHNFIRSIAQSWLQYGRVYAMVDSPTVVSDSAGRDRQLGLRPYGEIWNPLNVPDWEVETVDAKRLGKLSMLQVQYVRIPPRTLPTEQPTEELIRKVLTLDPAGKYTITYYKGVTQKKSANANDNQAQAAATLWDNSETRFEPLGSPITINELDELPVVYRCSESWIKQVAPLNLRHYQLESEDDTISAFQAYTRIICAGNPDKIPPRLLTGPQTMIWVGEGTQVTAVPSEDGLALRSKIGEIRNTIFRVGLNQFRQLDGSSAQVQSADTIREEKEHVYTLAKQAVSEIETIINEFVGYWAKFKTKDVGDSKISLSTDFSTQDIDDFMKIYNSLTDVKQGLPTLNKELTKKLVSYADFPKETETKIEAEIDAKVQVVAPPPAPSLRQALANP